MRDIFARFGLRHVCLREGGGGGGGGADHNSGVKSTPFLLQAQFVGILYYRSVHDYMILQMMIRIGMQAGGAPGARTHDKCYRWGCHQVVTDGMTYEDEIQISACLRFFADQNAIDKGSLSPTYVGKLQEHGTVFLQRLSTWTPPVQAHSRMCYQWTCQPQGLCPKQPKTSEHQYLCQPTV